MNRSMAAKKAKLKKMKMMASKTGALNVSMQEYKWGDWYPYYVMLWKTGVDMYKDHAEYMRQWNAKKEVMA